MERSSKTRKKKKRSAAAAVDVASGAGAGAGAEDNGTHTNSKRDDYQVCNGKIQKISRIFSFVLSSTCDRTIARDAAGAATHTPEE
jgi:hypothetical protein